MTDTIAVTLITEYVHAWDGEDHDWDIDHQKSLRILRDDVTLVAVYPAGMWVGVMTVPHESLAALARGKREQIADDEVVVKREDVEWFAVPREGSKHDHVAYRAVQKRMRAALGGEDR